MNKSGRGQSDPSGRVVAQPEVIQKWDEQVFKIGETVPHEKDSAAPHRRSSGQTFPNRINHRR